MEETQLIESRKLRDQMSGRFEVLEKVKELLQHKGEKPTPLGVGWIA